MVLFSYGITIYVFNTQDTTTDIYKFLRTNYNVKFPDPVVSLVTSL